MKKYCPELNEIIHYRRKKQVPFTLTFPNFQQYSPVIFFPVLNQHRSKLKH